MASRSTAPQTLPLVTTRALGRAALQRQLLLARSDMTPLAAIRRLVALQAQEAQAPYVGLWSRLRRFAHSDLTALLQDRSLVRSTVLRGTQHMVAAEDFPWLRGLVQPGLRGRLGPFAKATRHVLDDLPAAVESLLADGTVRTRPEVGRLLAQRWPDVDPLALGWVAQALVPVVHPPTSRTWERPGGATPFALAADWIGRPLDEDPSPQALVRRHLTAFGPASVADIQTWSGVTRLAEVVQAMPDLRPMRTEDGCEVVDLADAVLPDPDTPAPPRFLPEFDNLVLAYADRTRIMDDDARRRVCIGSVTLPTLLVDGSVIGSWTVQPHDDQVVLEVRAFQPIPRAHREAVEEEGLRLLAFLERPGQPSVQITQADG